MAHFDERSGYVPCVVKWGCWWQTMDEVTIEVKVPPKTRSKDVQVHVTNKKLVVKVNSQTVVEGVFPAVVRGDDSLWTLEDGCLLRIVLPKVKATAGDCWSSLLQGQYTADPLLYDAMQKKLTLQRFQLENPGMDFSSADISGGYQDGGPQLPT